MLVLTFGGLNTSAQYCVLDFNFVKEIKAMNNFSSTSFLSEMFASYKILIKYVVVVTLQNVKKFQGVENFCKLPINCIYNVKLKHPNSYF